MRLIFAMTTAVVATAACLATSPAEAQHGAPADGEWRSYAGDSGSTKYSPLDQITADNFGDLEVLWHWESVDSHLVHSTPGGDSLVAADTLFDILQAEEPDLWTAFDGVRQTRTQPSIRALVGDAAHGGRHPLREHPALPGRGRRRPHRQDPVGARSARLRVGHAGHRAMAPPGRGVLGERRRRPHRVGHRRRLPHRGRRQDRDPRRRLRRQRACGSHRRCAARDPRRARHPEPAAALLAVAAARHPRHRHRRLDHQRPDHHPRGDARVRPRLRRALRAAPLGLPHRAPERRRVRLGHLAERVVALQRQHQHLVDDERRRGTRLGLPADRHADERLTTAGTGWATTCSPRASWRSTWRPANASGTSR